MVMLRIAMAAVGGSLGMMAARAVSGPNPHPWASAMLLMVGLAAGLGLAFLLSEVCVAPSGRRASLHWWSLGYSMAGGLLAGGAAVCLLAIAGDAAERPTLLAPPSTPLITAVAADMAATIVAASIAAGIAAASVGGAPRLDGRRGALLWGGVLGGACGALVYETLLYFLPRWERVAAGTLASRDYPLLAAAWLSTLAGAGVVVSERLAAILALHGQGTPVFIYAGATVLGSHPACDTMVTGVGVRPAHLRILWTGKRASIEALDDAEVLVNGEHVTEATLWDGDELQLGDVAFRVVYNCLRVRASDVRKQTDTRPTGPSKPPDTRLHFVVAAGPLLGEALEVPEGASVLGSDPDAEFRLPGQGISPHHATVIRDSDQVSIFSREDAPDLQVNGTPTREAALRPGDRVAVGEHLLLLVQAGAAPPARGVADPETPPS